MARVDWVDHGLENWARWKITGGSGGRGRSVLSGSAIFGMAGSRSGYRDVPIPVTDHEAVLMDRAVQDLQVTDELLHRTVVLAYLGCPARGQLTRLGVALTEGVAVRAITARLENADRHIVQWFRRRAEALGTSK